MGFKENLKAELGYNGLLVKELSALSGINLHTISNYLSTNNCIPTAENAVKIAHVLGVTVEYLVTGKDEKQTLSPNIRIVAETMKALDDFDRKMILDIALALKKKKEAGKQGEL
jgi:transcriptional regulator with XRE-family HTH domain